MIDCLVHLPRLELGLNPNFKLPQNNISYYCCEYKFDDVFDINTIEIFKNLGIYENIRGVQLFRSLGLENRNIHIDGTRPDIHEGVINWVSNDTADSSWSTDFFEVSITSGQNSDQKNNLGSKITFNEADCILDTSWAGPCSYPVLMRVNVPHKIRNLKDQPRWCWSIRFRPLRLDYFDLKKKLEIFV